MGVQQGGVRAKVSWTMHQYKMGIPDVIPTLQGCRECHREILYCPGRQSLVSFINVYGTHAYIYIGLYLKGNEPVMIRTLDLA